MDMYDRIDAMREALIDKAALCANEECGNLDQPIPVQVPDVATPVLCGVCGEPCTLAPLLTEES